MSSSMRALVVESKGRANIQEIQQPKLRNDYIKIKVLAVALNPTDWKHIDVIADKGVTVGCDVAGEVLEIGSEVRSKVSKGDKVYGLISGSNNSNHEDGAFAEYAVVKDGLFAKIPTNLSPEAASTLMLGLVTSGQGLYQSLELPWPNQPAQDTFPVLIYGGSTATGMLAIQLAKLSGLTVITTASKRNHQSLRELGANEVFDYSDPDVGIKIREYTNDKLYYVFDCISEKGSDKISADALASKVSPTGLHYSSLLPIKNFPRDDVNPKSTLAYTALGEAFEKFGTTTPAKPDHHEFARKFVEVARELVDAGKVKPVNYTVKDGGLDSIIGGLQELKDGKVSGTKLVYTIASV